MHSPDRGTLVCLLVAALLILLGCVLAFALVGYETLALLCWGCAALVLLFRALGRAGARGRHWARPLRRGLTALLAIGALLFGFAEAAVLRAAKTDAPPGVDYLIVLGAGVDGTEPSLSLRNRLEAALAYLQENPETVAIVSGGQGPGEQISEAEAMRVWLEARGVAPARIRMETQATSTAENLRFSLALIAQAGDTQASVAVCSSEYHLCRARALAREAGVEVYGVAGRTTLPLLRLNYFVREGLAMLWLWAW